MDEARLEEAELLSRLMSLKLELAFLNALYEAELESLKIPIEDYELAKSATPYNDADFRDGTEFGFTVKLEGIYYDYETVSYKSDGVIQGRIFIIRDGKAYAAEPDENGYFSFTLREGDSIRIWALDVGTLVYTLSEDAKGGYRLVSWQQGIGDAETGATFVGATDSLSSITKTSSGTDIVGRYGEIVATNEELTDVSVEKI